MPKALFVAGALVVAATCHAHAGLIGSMANATYRFDFGSPYPNSSWAPSGSATSEGSNGSTASIEGVADVRMTRPWQATLLGSADVTDQIYQRGDNASMFEATASRPDMEERQDWFRLPDPP